MLQEVKDRSDARLPPVSKGAELTPLAQAATEFGVSTMTLYRWIAAGKLTRYDRPGGRPRVFVDKREVRRLLEPRPRKVK